jgi:hypothetical protein
LKTGEECPGEYICTKDTIRGRCVEGTDRTLENYCHDREGGCELYFTKAGSTPLKFRGCLNAASVWRARQKGGLSMQEDLMPFWAEKAYLIGLHVFAQVENELNEEAMESDGKPKSEFQITSPGDSGAFADIFAYLQQKQAQASKVEDEDDYDGY